ncbi:hypothetical protein [Paenibacillus xylanilyticus]
MAKSLSPRSTPILFSLRGKGSISVSTNKEAKYFPDAVLKMPLTWLN